MPPQHVSREKDLCTQRQKSRNGQNRLLGSGLGRSRLLGVLTRNRLYVPWVTVVTYGSVQQSRRICAEFGCHKRRIPGRCVSNAQEKTPLADAGRRTRGRRNLSAAEFTCLLMLFFALREMKTIGRGAQTWRLRRFTDESDPRLLTMLTDTNSGQFRQTFLWHISPALIV